MRKTNLFISLAATIVISFAFAGIGGASDIGATVKQACSTCHSSKRVCLNVGVKSAEEWKATVKRMVDKGARLAPDQVDAATEYLFGLTPGSGTVCQ